MATRIRLDNSDPNSPDIKILSEDAAKTVTVDPDFRYRLTLKNVDPEGFFTIWVNQQDRLIEVKWFRYNDPTTASLSVLYRGKNAPSIYDQIITDYPQISPYNATALGYDLAIAEMDLHRLQENVSA